MSQQKIRWSVSAPGFSGAQIAEVDCLLPARIHDETVLTFLQDFVKRGPDVGSVTIRWEKVSPSTTTPPESSL